MAQMAVLIGATPNGETHLRRPVCLHASFRPISETVGVCNSPRCSKRIPLVSMPLNDGDRFHFRKVVEDRASPGHPVNNPSLVEVMPDCWYSWLEVSG